MLAATRRVSPPRPAAAAEQGVWAGRRPITDPGVRQVGQYVGDATRAVPPDRVRDIVGADRELARHPGCPPGSVGRRGIPPAQ
jgi:hypothetical protein